MGIELLSCVDPNGVETAPRPRSQCHGDPGLTHRVIHVMVEDTAGRILLQRRSVTKDIQPGKWDMAVGGHLLPGEGEREGALREFNEELGPVPGLHSGLHRMYQYTWVTDLESERVTSFRTVSDGPFRADPEEIAEIRFFSPSEIDRLAESEVITPNFRYEWSLYRRWKAGEPMVLHDYPVAQICDCRRCERLVCYCRSIAGKGRRAGSAYWNRPVPGFGDPDAKILIVGLAPGAHGANRTGRPFTGDAAGEVLFRALHRTGLGSGPSGEFRGDGLTLRGVFITNAVKCAPPDNRPAPAEITACLDWFDMEMRALPGIRLIISLGRLAFESVRKSFIRRTGDRSRMRGMEFGHGNRYEPGSGLPGLAGIYHPSRRNLNTGLITEESFCRLFEKLCKDA